MHKKSKSKKGISIIEVIISSMIISVSVVIFIVVAFKSCKVLNYYKESMSDYTCVNSVYNYFSNLQTASINNYNNKETELNSILESEFPEYCLKVESLPIHDNNSIGQKIELIKYDFNITKRGKSIGGFQLLRSLN